jgi:hypothetical protein
MHAKVEGRRAIIKGRATFGGKDKIHSSRNRGLKQQTINDTRKIGHRKNGSIIHRDNIGTTMLASEGTERTTMSGTMDSRDKNTFEPGAGIKTET